MENNSGKVDPGRKKLELEELRCVSGGVLSEEEKYAWRQKIRRLKVFCTLDEVLANLPEGDAKDYVREVWAQVPPLVEWEWNRDK